VCQESRFVTQECMCGNRYWRFSKEMRYIYCFIVCILLSLPVTAENSVLKKAELRVLDIGNSYTNGATSLLPLIAKASKADLSTMCLYKCIRGGASFKNWVDIL
jgi:hypothetical protein